jgi:hypothetical protein
VAELVDARDSKSRFFGSMGSIPIAGISSLDVVGFFLCLEACDYPSLFDMRGCPLRPLASQSVQDVPYFDGGP